MSYSKEQIDNLLNETENFQYVEFNKTILKELLTNISSNLEKDLENRKIYKTNYEKYISIEEQLNDDLSILQRLAAYPKLILDFIELNGVEMLCKILNHPNIDIVNRSINLIQEITEGDFLNEIEDPKSFLELFLNNNLFELLVDNLFKIENEISKNEDCIQYKSDILSIIENYLDIYSLSYELLGKQNKIFKWLLLTIKNDTNDIKEIEIKLFASEILNQLLQNSDKNRIIFFKEEGLPILINIILVEKNNFTDEKKNDSKLIEFINNIVDSICSSMLEEKNQEIFNKSDGINLFIESMKENNIFRHLSLKILTYSLLNNKENCIKFIENNGLSLIFSYYMGKGLKKFDNKKIKKGEENVLEIISNLIQFCNGIYLERLINKFAENKYEKIKRLVNYYIEFHNGDDEEQKYIFQQLSIITLYLIHIKNNKNQNLIKYNKISDKLVLRLSNEKIENMKMNISKIIEENEKENEEESEYLKFLKNLIL